MIFLRLVERSEAGDLLPQIRCTTCSSNTRPSSDKSTCVPCKLYPILGKDEVQPTLSDEVTENEKGCSSDSRCESVEGGICIPKNIASILPLSIYQVSKQTYQKA